MKVALCIAVIVTSASAFAPQASNFRASVTLDATSRREAFGAVAAAAAAFLPAAALAAAGESPRFSVFGLVGDGTSMSEGAAYGTDQRTKLYSPYSVYGNADENSLYKPGNDEEINRKKAILAESRNRLSKIPGYITKKEWSNVGGELNRYMNQTRGAVRSLAKTNTQKEAAEKFFKAIEATDNAANYKKQEACSKAADNSVATLDSFMKTI